MIVSQRFSWDETIAVELSPVSPPSQLLSARRRRFWYGTKVALRDSIRGNPNTGLSPESQIRCAFSVFLARPLFCFFSPFSHCSLPLHTQNKSRENAGPPLLTRPFRQIISLIACPPIAVGRTATNQRVPIRIYKYGIHTLKIHPDNLD